MPATCPHCSREFKGDRVDPRHARSCTGQPAKDIAPCLCGATASTSKLMKIHRKTCAVWAARDKRAVRVQRLRDTSLARYGVEDCRRLPEANARREKMNLERYGAMNPFAREASTFEAVQAALDGKRPVLRGQDNPFAKDEVKEKVRKTMLERHGAKNPQQAPAIRARTRATSHARYGGELLGSPELRTKARTTNLQRHGDEFPQRTEAVKGRAQATNLLRRGVPWTGMDPEVRRRQLETHHTKYGSHYFASEEGREAVRTALLEKYGVEAPGAIKGHWEKVVATFQRKYGVDHPLQLVEFMERRHATNLERYGTIIPGLRERGMNSLEQKVFDLSPAGSLTFTGDGRWWRYLPSLKHNKNPDFIVPGPDPSNPKRGVTKVVEAFGDFWHSRMFTGRVPWEHEQDLVAAYAEVGIECLVLWEREVKANPAQVQGVLHAFLAGKHCSPGSPDA